MIRIVYCPSGKCVEVTYAYQISVPVISTAEYVYTFIAGTECVLLLQRRLSSAWDVGCIGEDLVSGKVENRQKRACQTGINMEY